MYFRFQYKEGVIMQEQILKQLKDETQIMSEKLFCYSVRHSVFRDEPPVFLLSKIMPELMDVLIYALQKRYSIIAEENVETMTHGDVASLMIGQGFAVPVEDTHIPESIANYRSFDLYDNWDIWDLHDEAIFKLPVIQNIDWEAFAEKFYALSSQKVN